MDRPPAVRRPLGIRDRRFPALPAQRSSGGQGLFADCAGPATSSWSIAGARSRPICTSAATRASAIRWSSPRVLISSAHTAQEIPRKSRPKACTDTIRRPWKRCAAFSTPPARTSAPGVRVPPFENVHLYPLLAKILGLETEPMDGDLRVLQPILRSATAAAPGRRP